MDLWYCRGHGCTFNLNVCTVGSDYVLYSTSFLKVGVVLRSLSRPRHVHGHGLDTVKQTDVHGYVYGHGYPVIREKVY